jgi:hypothetical protein
MISVPSHTGGACGFSMTGFLIEGTLQSGLFLANQISKEVYMLI